MKETLMYKRATIVDKTVYSKTTCLASLKLDLDKLGITKL